ncbi:MAG: hypothetical protein M3020_02515 [Myxococcota bacterium]|nr:hypothetical protein [Myxococcota bacterium]
MLTAGANRGARENVPAFRSFNERSIAAEIVPIYVDPVPGRAVEQQRYAELQGVRSGAIEGRVEDVVKAIGSASDEPVAVHIDRASGVASVLRGTMDARRALLIYLLVRLPSGRLLGVACAFGAGDRAAREGAAVFFQVLADVSERNGSDAILGSGADPAHVRAEPAIRAWFRRHTEQNLAKIAAGLEPATNTCEVTPDGSDIVPLVAAIQAAWSDPVELAERILGNPTAPIRRGSRFMLAEVVPGAGIRLHPSRRRTDGRVTVNGVEIVDRSEFERVAREHETRELARREAAERQAELARVRAERETLSLLNPVLTTD